MRKHTVEVRRARITISFGSEPLMRFRIFFPPDTSYDSAVRTVVESIRNFGSWLNADVMLDCTIPSNPHFIPIDFRVAP